MYIKFATFTLKECEDFIWWYFFGFRAVSLVKETMPEKK